MTSLSGRRALPDAGLERNRGRFCLGALSFSVSKGSSLCFFRTRNRPPTKNWRGAACSAWRRPRRPWEPQATSPPAQSGQRRFQQNQEFKKSSSRGNRPANNSKPVPRVETPGETSRRIILLFNFSRLLACFAGPCLVPEQGAATLPSGGGSARDARRKKLARRPPCETLS